MKCLSVRQPWANAIFDGTPTLKDVENRTWKTDYRGPLAIHASLRIDPDPVLLKTEPRGVLLGMVTLTDIVRDSKSGWAEPGMFHWLLANPQKFKAPIPCSGRLGIFEIEIPDEALLEAQKG